MGTHPVTDARLREILEVRAACNNSEEAAEKLGISSSVVRHHIRTANLRGLGGFKPVLKGFEVSRISTAKDEKTGEIIKTYVTQKPERGSEFVAPPGMTLRAVTADIGPDGRVNRQWPRYAPGEPDIKGFVEYLRDTFADYHGSAAPLAPMKWLEYSTALTFIPVSDLHMGLYAYGREAGENWNLRIAEDELIARFSRLISYCPPGEEAFLLFGGDAMHADNKFNETLANHHNLDVDGRYDRVLLATCFLTVRFVECCLQKYKRVKIRVLKGNHDEHSSTAICYFLLAHFRNEPRVEVDTDPNLFWFYIYGKNYLSSTHCHTVKISQLPMIMAADHPEYWGASEYRYGHGFHVHHYSKAADEIGGVILESHQALCPRSTYEHGAGFRSGRSFNAIFYDPDYGEVGRRREPVLKRTEA